MLHHLGEALYCLGFVLILLQSIRTLLIWHRAYYRRRR